MKNSEEGFVMILVLALLPLFLSIGIVLGLVAHYRLTYSKAQFECRTAALQVQASMGKYLTQLLALNKRAKALRLQRRAADIAASTPGPHQSAAIASRQALIALQNALHIQQRLILMQAKSDSMQILLSMRRVAPALKDALFIPPKLAVYPYPPTETAPEYRLEIPFEQRQSLWIHFQYSQLQFIPPQLIQWAERNNVSIINFNKISADCSSTLTKEGGQWQSTLGRGRS